MAYEKTNWNTGDIITAEKLNHAEQGIADASNGGGGNILTYSITIGEIDWEDDSRFFVFDNGKTHNENAEEIFNAIESKTPIYLYASNEVTDIKKTYDDIYKTWKGWIYRLTNVIKYEQENKYDYHVDFSALIRVYNDTINNVYVNSTIYFTIDSNYNLNGGGMNYDFIS